MFLSDRIWRAIERSGEWHAGQKRKVSDLPYVVHPYAVGFLLAHYTDDEDIVIAGLLHDVLEDVPGMTRERIAAEFGERVASIVAEVTEDQTIYEDHPELPHPERVRLKKADYLRRLADDSEAALMVAAADKICNTRSVLAEYPTHPGDFWERYRSTPERYLRFLRAFRAVIVARLKHPLTDELISLTTQAEAIIEKEPRHDSRS